jgi:hypothetical protein
MCCGAKYSDPILVDKSPPLQVRITSNQHIALGETMAIHLRSKHHELFPEAKAIPDQSASYPGTVVLLWMSTIFRAISLGSWGVFTREPQLNLVFSFAICTLDDVQYFITILPHLLSGRKKCALQTLPLGNCARPGTLVEVFGD